MEHTWPLPKTVVLKMMFRSLLMQASWNYERLQNLGFLYVIYPGLRLLYPDNTLTSVAQRHLEYFNTHPYLAPSILGAALHLEAGAACGTASAENVQEFKKMVMAPYAAMGDAFFWGGLRPFAAVTALFFAFKGSLWAIPVFLVLFNIPHLVFRVMGFRRGLTLGLGVIHVIQAHRLPDLAMKTKEATVVLFGGFTAFLTLNVLNRSHTDGYWGFLSLPLVLMVVWLIRKRVPPLFVIMSAVAAMVVLGLFL